MDKRQTERLAERMLRILGNGTTVEGIVMDEVREALWWHERLIMRREYACDKLREAKSILKELVEAGGRPTERQLAKIADLEAQAASARQSRRDYEADIREVELRRERDPGKRGANGRRRAACVDRLTGREVSPRAFTTGPESWAVAQARADGNATYREVRDGLGVLLRIEAVLNNLDGTKTGYGALLELEQFKPTGPRQPDEIAISRAVKQEARDRERQERREDCERANRRALELRRQEGRADGTRRKRGKRGGRRGRGSRYAKRLAAVEAKSNEQ